MAVKDTSIFHSLYYLLDWGFCRPGGRLCFVPVSEDVSPAEACLRADEELFKRPFVVACLLLCGYNGSFIISPPSGAETLHLHILVVTLFINDCKSSETVSSTSSHVMWRGVLCAFCCLLNVFLFYTPRNSDARLRVVKYLCGVFANI